MTKSEMLRALLNSDQLEFIMEAHSGLSAKIVEEEGFKGIWASGLSMSAMTGCRDRNELDISEVCKIIEWMADHTTIPILVDGDTGGESVNSARIMVNKLTKAGAAGVCIEDKVFPKHNSFLFNSEDDLADPRLHAAKIRAMKDENPDFVVIARLESFIARQGVDEAYRRAKIYQSAGADAILVHSKIDSADEIESFMNLWNQDEDKIPIVIVPTKYYRTPTDEFRKLGISLVIWANHNLRSSIQAMQTVTHRIHKDESLINVERKIATVKEIFRLQDDSAVDKNELKFFGNPSNGQAFILSGKNINNTPVSYLHSCVDENKTYYDSQVETYNCIGVRDISVILSKNSVRPKGVDNIIYNYYNSSTEVGSIYYALDSLYKQQGYNLPVYLSYGDLVFNTSIINKLDSVNADIVLALTYEKDPNKYNEYVKIDKDQTGLGYKIETSPKDTGVSLVGIIKVKTAKGLVYLHNISEEISKNYPDVRFILLLKYLLRVKELSIKGVMCSYYDWIDHDDKEKIKKLYKGNE